MAVQSDRSHIQKKKKDNVVRDQNFSRNDKQSQETKNVSNKKRSRTENQESNKSLKISKKSKIHDEKNLKTVTNDNNKGDDLIHPDVLAALQACESFEFT